MTEVSYKVLRVLQNVSDIKKCDFGYYRMCQILKSVTDYYYKVHQVLQNVTVITEGDVTKKMFLIFLEDAANETINL